MMTWRRRLSSAGGRNLTRRVMLAVVLAAGLAVFATSAQTPAVRVWASSMELPTYAEAPPNPNPPFDLFALTRFNYPYTIRDALTNVVRPQRWRTLHLENEYLTVTVLPDLGGHIYSARDRISGRELFYANPSIKKALIGYRGAWAAFGVEFNFPVSHNWVSMSPVDFATARHDDGSKSIWIGNRDAVDGMRWRVELRLRPGRGVIEQHVALDNPTPVRHRYYWWSNAAVQVWDDSRLVYPTAFMATHGMTRIVPWPVNEKGIDLSVIRNQTDGPVSLFTYGTREPYVGVYHPRTNSGTVHWASPAQLPTRKVWSWGADAAARDWRRALSDNESAYIELQGGLFRNQETYAFLEPQTGVRFTEYWLPVRDIGGITRATLDAVLHAERPTPSSLSAALMVTRRLPNARLRITQMDRVLVDETVSMRPEAIERRTVTDLSPSEPWMLELADADGVVVLSHTEGKYDLTPAEDIVIGPQPSYEPAGGAARREGEYMEHGREQELDGQRLAALRTYREGLRRFPSSVGLLKASSRLAVALHWPHARAGDAGQAGEGADARAWLAEAYRRDPSDGEIRYYLGLAEAAAGLTRSARIHFEAVQRFDALRGAALLALARLAARDGNLLLALDWVEQAAREVPAPPAAGELQVALLRRSGDPAGARERLAHWRSLDPTSSLLRYEQTRLGQPDPSLVGHLATDPVRVLDLVDQYFSIGSFADAVDLLSIEYPKVQEPHREPGVTPPQARPLLAYYRGYCRERLGHSGREDYQRASRLSTTYEFPSRASTYAVLRAALRANPGDGTARFLLGSLYLSAGLVEEAVSEWERARTLAPDIPTLHRNLGLTLLRGLQQPVRAREVLAEGLVHDAANVEVYEALDQVLSLLRSPARERMTMLERFPDPAARPPRLTFALALAYAEAGDHDAADAQFRGRFFPREEGGTNVRLVYLAVRLARARAAAAAGECRDALATLDSLTGPVNGLEFTRDGLADVAGTPMLQVRIAEVEEACGRTPGARARLERLVKQGVASGRPFDEALAYRAAQTLGLREIARWRERLTEARATLERTLRAGSATGRDAYTLGLLLESEGRRDEARQAFIRALRLPDRHLSHYLAREALGRLGSG